MSGPEHYRRAEALLAGRNNGGSNGARSCEEAIALAQVHATLALAAAQLRSITDEDIVRCPHGAATCGLCGYGMPAGDGGGQR